MADNTISQMNGFTKRVYGKLIEALPDDALFLQELDFSESQKVGRYFSETVTLTDEHGITYIGATDSITSLNSAKAAVMDEALIEGYETDMTGRISYKMALSAMAKGPKAHGNAMAQVLMNLRNSFGRKMEMELLYGQKNLCSVDTSVAVTTTITMTIADGHFAPGHWIGGEGMLLDVYNGTDKVNDNATLVLSTVSFDNSNGDKKLICTGNATDLAAIQVLTDAGTAVDVLPYGAYGKQMLGLFAIAQTTSGDLFSVSTDYAIWKPNAYACGSSALTMSHILQAHEKSFYKGLRGDCTCWIPTASYVDLAAQEATYRVYDSSYGSGKVAKTGFRELEFQTQGGVIRIKGHTMIKSGEALITPNDEISLVGSSEITSNVPGSENGRIWYPITGYNGAETKLYCDMAVFCRKPGQLTYISGIA